MHDLMLLWAQYTPKAVRLMDDEINDEQVTLLEK